MEPSLFNDTPSWGHHVNEVYRLYYDEKWTQKQVQDWMKTHRGLEKSAKQYKDLFAKSGRGKNANVSTYKYIEYRVNKRRGENKRSEVLLWNKVVPEEKLKSEFKRYAGLNKQPQRAPSPDFVTIRTPASSSSPPDAEPPVLTDPQEMEVDEEAFDVDIDLSFLRESPSRAFLEEDGEEEDNNRSLSLPTEYMGDVDQGSLQNLTLQLREAWLRGIPFAAQISRGNVLPTNICLVLPAVNGNASNLLKDDLLPDPDSSWLWESLVMVLASATDFRAFENEEWSAPRGMNLASHLSCLSRNDLLNIVVSVILNGTSYRAFRTRLLSWLSRGRPLRFLQTLLLNGIGGTPRLRDLAMALITVPRAERIQEAAGATAVAAEALLTMRSGDLTSEEAREICNAGQHWEMASLLVPVVAQRPDVVASDTRSKFLEHAVDTWSPQLTSLILSMRPEPKKALYRAMQLLDGAPRRWKGFGDMKDIIASLLRYGADPNFTESRTYPLSAAEHCVLKHPHMRETLEPYFLDETSCEIVAILQGKREPPYLAQVSELARQVTLLYAAQNGDIDLSILLIEGGVDSNVPLLARAGLIGRYWWSENGTRRLWPFTTGSRDCGPVLISARGDLARLGSRPIDFAFQRADLDFTRTLLKAGSRPPSQLLELSELLEAGKDPGAEDLRKSDEHIKALQKDIHDIGESPQNLFWKQISKLQMFAPGWVPPNEAKTRQTAKVNRDVYMDHLATDFVESGGEGCIRNALTLWAIHRQDAALLRDIEESGIGLPIAFKMSRPGKYGGFLPIVTPLMMALLSCHRVSFWESMWRLQPHFLQTGSNATVPGYLELISICASVQSGGTHDTDKLRFLLFAGAKVRYRYSHETLDDAVITPVEIILGREIHVSDDDLAGYNVVDSPRLQRISRLNILLRSLVEKDADVNASHAMRKSPLQLAAKCGNFYAMKLLLLHGADIDLQMPENRKGPKNPEIPPDYGRLVKNPLITLCHDQRRWYYNAPDDNWDSPTLYPKRVDEHTVLEHLLANGADVNFMSSIGTPLWLSCLTKDSKFVDLLLSAGVNVNLGWTNPETGKHEGPLDRVMTPIANDVGGLEREKEAFHRANRALALLRAGANPTAGLLQSQALLNAARLQERAPLFDAFMLEAEDTANEAEPQLTSDELLSKAIHRRDMEGAKAAIQAGATLNSPERPPKFPFPLYDAATKGSVAMALLLLDSGADLFQRSHENKDVLSVAAKVGDYDMVQLFLNVGGSKFSRGMEHHVMIGSAIRGAMRYEHTHVIRLLKLYE